MWAKAKGPRLRPWTPPTPRHSEGGGVGRLFPPAIICCPAHRTWSEDPPLTHLRPLGPGSLHTVVLQTPDRVTHPLNSVSQ